MLLQLLEIQRTLSQRLTFGLVQFTSDVNQPGGEERRTFKTQRASAGWGGGGAGGGPAERRLWPHVGSINAGPTHQWDQMSV